MNIAMFTDAFFPRINGVAISVKSYADMLVKLGHKVCIVCCNYEKSTKDKKFSKIYYDNNTENSNLTILRVPTYKVFFSKEDRAGRLFQWKKFKKELDNFNPDIVHVNSEFVMGYFGARYAKKRKVPMVFTFHTLWEDYVEGYIHFMPTQSAKRMAKNLIKFYLKRADELICPTQRIVDVVKQYKVNRNTDILPTGIPEEMCIVDSHKQQEFKKQIYEKFPEVKNKKILLYVGRVVKEKNLDFLFPVLFNVKKEIPDAVLMIVGGGPELERLRRKAKELCCEDSVCFTDYQPRDSLVYFYSLADVFVFPSCTETQGLVTIEAMLSGLPVVAIGEMGTVDVMQGNNGGFMVGKSHEAFSDKVILLLKNSQVYAEKKQEALTWGKKWSIEALTPRLIEYYNKAIEIKNSSKKNK